MSKIRHGFWFHMLFLAIFGSTAIAQAPVTDDTFVSSAVPNSNNGTSPSMVLQAPAGWSFVKFDLSRLPAGTTSSSVTRATVKLYATAVTAQGSFDLFRVDSAWAENTLTYSNTTTPYKSSLSLILTPITTGICGATPVQCVTTQSKYVIVDVTSVVKQWLDFQNGVGGFANNGIAFKPSSGSSISATFETKESTTTSHDSDLNIVLLSASGSGVASVTASSPLGNIGTAANPNITITGVIPSVNLSGTYGINISGNAVTATSASTAVTASTAATATTATNATQLGGIAATNYSRIDQGNTFTGVNVLGNTAAGAGGLVIPPNGSGFTRSSFLFNLQSTGASLTNTFGFQVSTTPSLNLMFCNSAANCAPTATGLSIASNGVITFVAGQTFPGAGVGTVTAFSAGSLSPLFSTSVTTPTSTPALSFNLNTQSAHAVFAGPASGTAAPTFRGLLAADIPSLPESQITNLTTDLSNLQSNISTETARATSAETTITGNLNSEITRAQNAEGAEAASRAAVDVALSASVVSETGRATAAEGTISTNLSNEVSRATAAEATKADLVKPVQVDNSAFVNGSCSAVNALVLNTNQPSGQQLFICRDIGSSVFHWQFINDDSTTSSAANTYTDQQVAAEATARAAADAAETTARVAGDAATLSSANQYTDTSVASEATARIAGDAATLSSANSHADTAVAAEAVTRATADATLGGAISAEATRATGAETTLQSSITALDTASAKLTSPNTFTADNTFTGAKVDLSGAAATLPVKTTTTAPPASGSPNACVAGQMLLQTTGNPGQQLFICNAALDGWAMVNDDTATTAADHTYTDSAVAAEATARAAADAAETTARVAGDAATLSSANQYTDTSVASEATARIAGDAATLSSANSHADTAVAAEAVSRAMADAALSASIATESTRAVGAESTLQTHIDTLSVSSAKLGGDNTFTGNNSFTGRVDLSGSSATLPVQMTHTLPPTSGFPDSCVVGQMVLYTDGTPGQQLFICNAALDGWVKVNDDTATSSAANTYTDQQVAAEATSRAAADATETTARQAADVTLQSNIDAEAATRAAADAAEAATRTAADAALGGSIAAETTRATAAEATKADLDGGNIFTGGSQKLAPSTTTYASLNMPSSATPPSSPVAGDFWLTNGDIHLKFRDQNNATHSMMFSDDTINNTQLSNSSFGVTLGSGLSGSSSVALGGTLSLSNTGVLSFNGRNGSVSPASGDYSFSQISGAITSAQAGAGTYGIDISGNAATATLAASATSAGNASLLSGEAAATAATSSTIAARDASGDLFANIFHGSGASLTNIPTTALPATIVYKNQANTYTAGSKQTFNASSTLAGLNIFGVAVDPTGPLTAGDAWFNTASTHLRFFDGTTTHSLAFSDDTITGNAANVTGIVAVVNGGTGANNAVSARANLGAGTVTSVATGAGLTGGPITNSGTISIPSAGVTNAMLANSSVTVSAGTGLSGGGAVSLGGSTSLNLANTAVTAGTYTAASVTVDAQGRITAASSNTIPTVPIPVAATQSNSGTLTTTAYTATLGGTPGTNPSVTVTVGASGNAMVTVSGSIQTSNTVNQGGAISFAISGSTTRAAADATSYLVEATGGNGGPGMLVQGSATYFVTGLTPGSNTFTLQYRAVGGGTQTFANRSIIVTPY